MDYEKLTKFSNMLVLHLQIDTIQIARLNFTNFDSVNMMASSFNVF